jgi:DSF synthase
MTNSVLTYDPRDPEAFPRWEFETLDIDYDRETQSVWMSYKASAPHSYSLKMLAEIADVRESLRALFGSPAIERHPIRYFVMASKKPNVFSLGGDLASFAAAIRRRDLDSLYHYGHVAIDVIHGLTASFDLPIVTLSVVAGQCLGGGFEGALTTDFLIAESDAKLGVPEQAFNTFPGMGAVTLLTRRVGSALSEQIISSGAAYSGTEMHDMGVVDVVAPPGRLRETALAWMLEGEERWLRRRALAQTRRQCFPVEHEELIKIVELWAECSYNVLEQDLRHMERLVAAQKRLAPGARRQPAG